MAPWAASHTVSGDTVPGAQIFGTPKAVSVEQVPTLGWQQQNWFPQLSVLVVQVCPAGEVSGHAPELWVAGDGHDVE
jgi:hypothetical protein